MADRGEGRNRLNEKMDTAKLGKVVFTIGYHSSATKPLSKHQQNDLTILLIIRVIVYSFAIQIRIYT